jgi:hypothetical protein
MKEAGQQTIGNGNERYQPGVIPYPRMATNDMTALRLVAGILSLGAALAALAAEQPVQECVPIGQIGTNGELVPPNSSLHPARPSTRMQCFAVGHPSSPLDQPENVADPFALRTKCT